MFLKTALVDIVDAAEMRKRYGHDLIKLWQRFKEKTSKRKPPIRQWIASMKRFELFTGSRKYDTQTSRP
jgi:hypothetical protein